MSTILKALRRLEHDRSARSGRPLRQEVMSEPKSRPRARRWPLLVAAVVFGIAAGPMALVMWTELLPKTGAPESSSVSTASVSDEAQAAAPIVPSEPLETLPAPEPLAALPADEPETPEFVAEAPPPPVISSEVEVLRRPAREPRIAAHVDDVPPEPTDPPLGSVRPRPSSDWMPVAGRPSVSTAPAPTEAAATRRRPWEIDTAPEPEPGPELAMPRRSDPAAGSAPAPTVRVERTEWHPSPERRVAIVALEGADGPLRLQEGDAVGALVVGEIRPSAVTFYYEGIELRRRVGDTP